MAISPLKLVEMFRNPVLSEKDKVLVNKIIKSIDEDIVRRYGNIYNNGQSPETIPDGFKCIIYIQSKSRNVDFQNSSLSLAYTLNQYRDNGWDVEIKNEWIFTFSKAKQREQLINTILNDDDDR